LRVREGSRHEIFKHPDNPVPVAVPNHRVVSPGVIRNIAAVLGESAEEFAASL
jgi:predicted RNA binding protein YcfA (HicA-like mRNA interferase family)